MGWRIHSGMPWSVALGAAALALFASAAGAADYCVTCKGPDETYRCRVTGDGIKAGDALKLYCVIRTAKEGNHASCKAEKATSDCVGLVKVYTYDGPTLPRGLNSDPRVRDLNDRVERDRQTFKEPSGSEPKSLFELGGRAVDASRKGLRNAGSAIGLGASGNDVSPKPAPAPPANEAAAPPPANEAAPQASQAAAPPPPAAEPEPRRSFARRSYDCVFSFFRDCSGNE